MKNWEKQIPPRDLENIYKICRVYQEHGHEIYIVGGAVRDLIIGNKAKDFDFATSASPDFAEEKFEKTNPIGKAFGTIQIVLGNHTYEVTQFRNETAYSDGRHPDQVTLGTLLEDAKRRDFRMNAIYWNPLEEELLDPLFGKKDIENEVITFIGEAKERILEDHLRILRAYRFHAQLGFNLAQGLEEVLADHVELLHKVSWNRRNQEVLKTILGKEAVSALSQMQKAKVLEVLYYARPNIDFYNFITSLLYVKPFNLCEDEIYGFFLYYVAPNLHISNMSLSKQCQQAFFLSHKLSERHLSDLEIYKHLSNFKGTFLFHLLQNTDKELHSKLRGLFAGDPHKFNLVEAIIRASDLQDLGLQGKRIGEALDFAYESQLKDPALNKESLLQKVKANFS